MEKSYHPAGEMDIYRFWQDSGAFTPSLPKDPKKTGKRHLPFTIILPPPNANHPLHAGHVLYVVEDIMARFHRMSGDPTLWLPGTDHAGIETQFVFEKKLQQEGKSRFDYDRNTLYQMIAGFVDENRGIAIDQMKRLGFSLDWTRLKFTLDADHTDRIFAVFRRLVKDGLVFRDDKIVNYCTSCGTAYSNLEVVHKTVKSFLWHIKYGPLTVATTRPETMLGDTAVAVNPNDPRYQKLIGTTLDLPLTDRKIPVIADDIVDPQFGTGAVKVTPAHSPEDYDIAKRHHLQFIRIINYDGRLNGNVPPPYRGLSVNQARQKVIGDLTSMGLIKKTEDYTHQVGHCYKCGQPIEPLTAPQWYLKVAPLAEKAAAAVQKDKILIFPKRFKKSYLTWMKNIRDWNISRQIVWGHRIPVWYNLDENPDTLITFINTAGQTVSGTWQNLQKNHQFTSIQKGLQSLIAPVDAGYYLTEKEALASGPNILQESDTFDTWFSSGQWPYSTLGWDPDGNHHPDFLNFFPTTVLDTMWDILFFWVARMIMFSLYATGDIPFKVAHMHSRVLDAHGKKMSKSRGNVINPMEIVDKYGADALRFALVYGIAPASDIALSEDKIIAQRNFVNKVWNASRYILIQQERIKNNQLREDNSSSAADEKIINKLNEIIASTTQNLNKYRFGQASENLYRFFWHDFCDDYLESTKDRIEAAMPTLLTVLITSLKLLHPFIPFVTESAYQNLKSVFNLSEADLITASWPEKIKSIHAPSKSQKN